MALVHAVLSDVDGGHQLNAVGQRVAEGDGGVGPWLAVVAHHHVEVSAVHLIYMILFQEGLFRRVESQVCPPVVDGVAFVHRSALLSASGQQHQLKYQYASPYSF